MIPDNSPAFENLTRQIYQTIGDLQPPISPVALRNHPKLDLLCGLDLPKRVGGSNWSAYSMARLFREMGRINLVLRDVPGGGHGRMLAIVPIRKYEFLLESLAKGSAYFSIAITEFDAGSDIQALSTAATPINGGYILNGRKCYVARIEECSHFIVFARVHRDLKGKSTITPFIVQNHSTGLSTTLYMSMGLTAVSWGEVELDDVFVPSSQRIGGEGQGFSLLRKHFTYWRTMMAAAVIGSAEQVLQETIKRMKNRQAFDGTIGRFTHLQQSLAIHSSHLRMAWLLVLDISKRIDSGHLPWFDACMVKAEATEFAVEATDWALRVFGAAGYDKSTGIEERYRDLLGLRIADGTTDVLRTQVSRAMLGEKIYNETIRRVGI